ncbi:MAG TPA: hypothetical protein VF475_09065 [Sphingobium sp.]
MLNKLRSVWAGLLMLSLLVAPDIGLAQRTNNPSLIGLAPKQKIAGDELVRTMSADGSSNATRVGDVMDDLIARRSGILTSAIRGFPVAFSGDSFMSSAYGGVSSPASATPTSATGISLTNNSPQNWLRYIFRERFYTDQSLSTAVGGMGLQHLNDVQLPIIQALAPPIDIVNCGTNDFGTVATVLTASQMTALARSYVTAANKVGTLVIWASVLPQSSWNAAQRQKAAEFNRQLWLMARDSSLKMVFVDLAPTMIDYSTGNVKAAFLAADNVHLLIAGWQAMAQAIQPTLDKYLPPVSAADLLPIDANDSFDATLAPSGNMHPAGMFAGNSSGLATNWYLAGIAGTVTATPTKGTDATLTTLPTQIVTLGGTADGNSPRLEFNLTPGTNFTNTLGAGDRVYAEVDISATGLTAVRAVSIVLQVTSGGITKTYIDGTYANVNGQATGNLPASFTALLHTPPMVLEGSVTAVRCYVFYQTASSGSLAGAIAHSRLSIRKAGLVAGVSQ